MYRFTILLVCVLVPVVTSKWIRPVTCPPVCAIACKYGNVLDKNGCSTCECRSSPCANGEDPLDGYNCGRVANRTDCPSTYRCVIAPNDAYAFCCPVCITPVTRPVDTTGKPGSCPPPPPPGTVGSCIAECTNDDGCEGTMKCCGNCPRKCVSPVF